MATLPLNLFTESLGVRFTTRTEEFLAALLPRLFEFGRCDVPVRPTFLSHGTQVLAEIFLSRRGAFMRRCHKAPPLSPTGVAVKGHELPR
jgi:hypothetical protein